MPIRTNPQDAQKVQTSHPPNPELSEQLSSREGYVEDFDELRTPLADFFTILLEDHSNRRTTQKQRGSVRSIDGRVAIAGHRTVFVECRLERKVNTDGIGF